MSRSFRRRSSTVLLAALLSACAPAPAGAPGAAPVASPAAAAPVNPAAPAAPVVAPPAAVEMTSLQGRVSLGGTAWANAPLKVFDAVKDRPADLFAPGTRPTGTTDLAVDASSLTTNANGDFTVNVANFKPGMAARIVATVGTQTLTAVITADGQTPGGYKVQAVFGCYVNEVSKMLDQISRGVLKMASGLTPAAAKAAVDEMMVKLNALGPKLQAAFIANPSLAASVASAPMSAGGVVLNETAVNSILTSAGLTDAVNAIVLDAVGDLAAQASLPGAVVNADAFENIEFIGTSVDVDVTGDSLVVSDDGETVSSSPVASGSTTGETPPSSGGGSSGGSDGASGDDDDFTPEIEPFTFDGSALSLSVAQADDEDDIETIVVRIPAGNVTLSADLSDDDFVLTYGTSQVVQGSRTRDLQIEADAAASGTSDIGGFNNTYSLGDSDSLADPDFAGFLSVDPSDADIRIATCRVYLNRGANESFHYVVLSYNEGGGVQLNSGHVSNLNLLGFESVDDETQAQVYMRSRQGNTYVPALSDTKILLVAS